MNYIDFFSKMQECRLVSSHWRNLLLLIHNEIKTDCHADSSLKLFVLYFSLLDDGNTYMTLNEIVLKHYFDRKIENLKIEDQEDEGRVNDYSEIAYEIESSLQFLSQLGGLSVIGHDRLFTIEGGCLFANKYYSAMVSIQSSVQRFFLKTQMIRNASFFNVDDYTHDISLEKEQIEVVHRGLQENLIVTGGPGTGKTTSIMFLLLGLLSSNPELNVFLTAPSGKAADRMGESLGEEKEHVKGFDQTILDKILALKGKTIHSLLKIDKDSNRFRYNKDHQFNKNSVFIIDEASMIDICLFASLLEAIPDGARIFILGDKNQLPSVECGAVFSKLLMQCPNNVVELIKAKRFPEQSDIYKLSEKVNQGTLDIDEKEFQPISDFKIEKEIKNHKVFYFRDNDSNKTIVETLINRWYETFFSGIQKECSNLSESDSASFERIIETTEQAKILCAQNDSARGTLAINKMILEKKYKGKKISGFYPGEILMIRRNIKSLDLSNGDCGVTVKFDGDENLYFMIKKNSVNLTLESGKKNNQLFLLEHNNNSVKDSYYFYPLRLIGLEDIVSAFAITIHKSQGSGYNNVAIILPKTEHHPLLNRQLLYTAITRTKGNTYIISNKNNLEYASKNRLERDTGRF